MSSLSSNNPKALGQALRKLREDKPWTLRHAAAQADMDPALLGNIERGQRLPTEKQILKLAAIYGEDSEQLLAARACCEFRQKYGAKEFYGQCLQILNEEASKYG
jgi:transcriptional regulator with XRE-family HTH domain